MARWQPDARGRLEQAALDLYRQHGFEQTTVAQIAQRAGLTERTFFRHFADKREVLFAGSEQLQAAMTGALAAAPPSATPIEAVAMAIEAAADVLASRRDRARQRQEVVLANAELRERELIKLARLSAALADGLRQRGVADPTAGLAADAGMAVFHNAFVQWIGDAGNRSFAPFVRAGFRELAQIIGQPSAAPQT